MIKIGVLGLQGDFFEHVKLLEPIIGSENVVIVKSSADIKNIDGLIIPGGESTTIGKLMVKYEIDKEIINSRLPVFGTCAGAIILAKNIIGSSQFSLNLLDISIDRNSYGRQTESFEADLNFSFGIGKRIRGVFIRAPTIKSVGEGVEILSELNFSPVLVRQGNILASTFHPELAGNTDVHKFFIENIISKQQIMQS